MKIQFATRYVKLQIQKLLNDNEITTAEAKQELAQMLQENDITSATYKECLEWLERKEN